MPVFNIVGLADTAIKESKERVRAAIKNSGYDFPLSRITINLAPANLRKESSQMDLAIAMGILISNGVVDYNTSQDTVFLGELSLDGKVNSIDGALPMIISLRELNISKCIIPYDNREECGVITDIEIIPVKSLKEVVDYLNKDLIINPFTRVENPSQKENYYDIDFSDIKGKRIEEGLGSCCSRWP